MMMQGRNLSKEATEEADVEPFSPHEEEDEEEEVERLPSTRKKKSKNKRRFTDEQVRSLETIFESETKLEPRKKVQVARELGLQPRQVAIWFQNKRARWKSKQIEKNHRVLKANYDNLKARFEALRKERDLLLQQLQELRSLLEKSNEGGGTHKDFTANNQDIGGEKGVTLANLAAKAEAVSLQEEMDHQGVLHSDDDKSRNMAYLGQEEEPELLNMSENIDGSIITPVKWCSFDAGSCFFDQSSTSSHWWDSWT